ncbi:MAG: hypothetical protein WA208_18650 [Thermoanaerobaculia bacterium]
MTILGALAGEPPEPMTRTDFERVQMRMAAWLRVDILLDREDALRMLDEIRWLRRRPHRVETAIEPLVEAITMSI